MIIIKRKPQSNQFYFINSKKDDDKIAFFNLIITLAEQLRDNEHKIFL